jgi:hypothetical protein
VVPADRASSITEALQSAKSLSCPLSSIATSCSRIATIRVGTPVRQTSATTRFKGKRSGMRSWHSQSRRETSGCRHSGVGRLSE